MATSQVASPTAGSMSVPSSRSRSSTKVTDDVTSLTSFNPFSEEDEHDQSSYTLVTSIFSRMKNSLSAPLSSANTISNSNPPPMSTTSTNDLRRPSYSSYPQPSYTSSKTSVTDRPNSLSAVPANPAPPLVSLTPAQSEVPSYNVEYERSPSRTGLFYSPVYESSDGGVFGTSIPGFPIQDDARSIKTTGSLHRSGSVSKVIRRIRGEGLSRDYWMDDENCKECYDCKSVFTAWRRKHHCRICGQIFCSRCASHIIKGARFGHDGMVRVCNLCMEKLGKGEDDDDDDRRSIVSSITSFPAHQLGVENMSLAHHPQSPFAASQLFGRTDEPFNLYSIAETKRPMSVVSDESGLASRPITPLRERGLNRQDAFWISTPNPAPFRRAIPDDESDLSGPFEGGESPINYFPGAVPIPRNGLSSVQFPMSSPERDASRPESRGHRRLDSYAEFESSTPFIRSRVQSRIDSMTAGEAGWRTRRESTAYAQELNLTSMLHLRIMLRQMLKSENIPNIREWEDTLLKLSLLIARELTFTVFPHRQGQDMDVRRYVKIKKIPGGRPQDSEYVDGVVITKNVAHKQMSRVQRLPRVMLVTFPLEFHRVEGQYVHFGQIVRQEKEYLGNLATRIASLRPHIVLAEKSVSRLVLEGLAAYNIAVARNVKPSAIQVVARMTQADVFSSMDKLALEPRLGHCARYRIQTFDHPLIPGRRKTYMRFEGCSRELGCTIILRGADIDTLRKLKKVTRFLTFVVRNLKLETHLWKDSVITLPSFHPEATPSRGQSTMPVASLLSLPSSLSTPTLNELTPQGETRPEIDDDLPKEEREQLKLSRRIDDSLADYIQTFISVSATLRFQPPYPIRRMKELDVELQEAKRAWEDEVIRLEEGNTPSKHLSEPTSSTVTVSEINTPNALVANDDLNAQIAALPSLSIPPTPTEIQLSPSKLDGVSYFTMSPATPITLFSPLSLAPSSILSLPNIDEPPPPTKTVEDIALESKFSLVSWKHQEFRCIWEWYLRKNRDDFVIERYQCISLMEYTVPIAEFGLRRACFAPRLTYITFYGENDCTLGQYIEKAVNETLSQFLDPKAICSGKGCDQPLARHCKVYVHNESKLFVAVEQWDGQIIGLNNPSPDLITTWSACTVCGSATPFIPVSEEMQRYSFGKFLELHFYPADVKLVQGAGCEHNIYQHHIRYFASKGMTVRFQSEPIVLHEIVYPPFRIRVRPETQLELKNSDFRRLHQRNLLWYAGLIDDLKLIGIDAATGDEEADAALLTDINKLINRAEAERQDIYTMINDVYKSSAPTDTIALNQVRAYRQDKIVAWQQDFDRLPKPRQTDSTGKRASTFGSVRAMWPRRQDLAGAFDHPHLPSSSVSEAEEGPFRMRRVTGDTFASSASEASEPEPEVPTSKPSVIVKVSQPAEAEAEQPANQDHPKTDPESDSTIGVSRDDIASPPVPQDEPVAPTDDEQPKRASRLPRRTNHPPSVAELVKKYSDFLPAQGIHDLAQAAFPPKYAISESEQEYTSPARVVGRGKGRHRIPTKKPSVSDFEQSYAANIAPRYLTHPRRKLGQLNSSRIPGPVGQASESHNSSRRPSPEKQPSNSILVPVDLARSPSPKPSGSSNLRRGRLKVPRENPGRAAPAVGVKTFRRPQAGTGGGGKVSNIAKHFERLGREAERNKSRYNVIRGRRARPVTSARARVEILDSVKDAIKDISDSSDSSSEADDEGDGNDLPRPITETAPQTESPDAEQMDANPKTAPPLPAFPKPTETRPDAPSTNTPPTLPPTNTLSLPPSPLLKAVKDASILSTPPASDIDMSVGGTERNSILKALSGLWLQQPPLSRNSYEGDDPMIDPEHIFRDSSMVVRTDEPTSIIALALNSPQYREMLIKSRAEKRTVREARLTDGGEAFMPDDRSVAESTSTWGVVNVDPAEPADPTEDLKVLSSKQPWAISFESGGLTISCTVLYPEQFDALRRTYDCDKSIIESLARCIKWNAGGGKSGSAFLKTRDDRFIAKELSRAELQTMETFAPAYFDYMSSAISSNRPTLLAKIFGCYKLTFRKTGNDSSSSRYKATQMNLLVMENLFYDRRFSKIYDLKGSTRNRHVKSTGKENEVLLDENLVETAHISPFYLREHSKRILRGALYNDSKFLADINVMDYSLVCGVDSQNNELVVGIVDYIRTYTWDKKLESWVKESAFLGSAGRGEPTIVTPKQYRQRFISAMERYFPLVPDRWMKHKDTPEEDSNILTELWPDW